MRSNVPLSEIERSLHRCLDFIQITPDAPSNGGVMKQLLAHLLAAQEALDLLQARSTLRGR